VYLIKVYQCQPTLHPLLCELGDRYNYILAWYIFTNMYGSLILGVISFTGVTRSSPVLKRDTGDFVMGADLNAPGMLLPGTANVMMANLCGQNPDTGM
jgi:hypothetical protein